MGQSYGYIPLANGLKKRRQVAESLGYQVDDLAFLLDLSTDLARLDTRRARRNS